MSFDNWGACFIYCGAVVILMGVIDLGWLPNLPAHPAADENTALVSKSKEVEARAQHKTGKEQSLSS